MRSEQRVSVSVAWQGSQRRHPSL